MSKQILSEKTEDLLTMTLIVMTDMLDEANKGGFVFNSDILFTAEKLCHDMNDTIIESIDNKTTQK